MYVRVGGRDGDSQSRVPSATLHVSITFCCPSTCLAGLADVNKIVSPFPTRARAGPPAPYTPRPGRGGTGGTGRAQHTLRVLGGNANQLLTWTRIWERGQHLPLGQSSQTQWESWIKTCCKVNNGPAPACCRPLWLHISHSLQALHRRWGECCGSWTSEGNAGKERLKHLPSLEHLEFCMWCVYHRHHGGSREQNQTVMGASLVLGTAPSRWGSCWPGAWARTCWQPSWSKEGRGQRAPGLQTDHTARGMRLRKWSQRQAQSCSEVVSLRLSRKWKHQLECKQDDWLECVFFLLKCLP